MIFLIQSQQKHQKYSCGVLKVSLKYALIICKDFDQT